jgi:ADP-ribose pyrophosphatase
MNSSSIGHHHLAWKEISRSHQLDAHIFQLLKVRRQAADGREGEFFLVEAPDWVNVVAVVPDSQGRDCFIMVRQYRHGSDSTSLEFPGGMVEDGEPPEIAAAREFSEESGYSAENLTMIGITNPNPAFMTNTVTTYLATGLTGHGTQELDTHEIVDSVLVPVRDVAAGRVPEFSSHAIMLAAYHWYERATTAPA